MYARNLQRTSENLEFPLDLEMFGECLDNLGGSTAEASLGRFGTSLGVLDVLGRFARRTGAHGAPLVLHWCSKVLPELVFAVDRFLPSNILEPCGEYKSPRSASSMRWHAYNHSHLTTMR